MINERRIESVLDDKTIYDLLIQFDCVFPHLHEKISSYEEYAYKLSRYAKVYVYKDLDKNIGILVLYANDMNNKIAYISLIGVDKSFEGKGIGKRLLNHAIQISKECGMNELKLEVDLDNERAIRFYKLNGFVSCNDDNGLSVHMIKKLMVE